ncbi:hypothetical protein ES332_A07G190700v1 [Gossypium tomentosum]|uniref:Transmembrane protein n=1 Tax=Gossypium tomentosum TaxID=34277 RepID=A0A5D2PXA6_GOSTO|nr:hypothetical protein ES332_A07G190700v1 [Gossypium tomentosum]
MKIISWNARVETLRRFHSNKLKGFGAMTTFSSVFLQLFCYLADGLLCDGGCHSSLSGVLCYFYYASGYWSSWRSENYVLWVKPSVAVFRVKLFNIWAFGLTAKKKVFKTSFEGVKWSHISFKILILI